MVRDKYVNYFRIFYYEAIDSISVARQLAHNEFACEWPNIKEFKMCKGFFKKHSIFGR